VTNAELAVPRKGHRRRISEPVEGGGGGESEGIGGELVNAFLHVASHDSMQLSCGFHPTVT
jgi:hypothetical protein